MSSPRCNLAAATATVMLGAIVVAAVFPFNCGAFFIWVGLLVWAGRCHIQDQRVGLTALVFAAQSLLMLALIIAAVLAPGKKTEELFQRSIELPRAELTLGEIEGEPDGARPDWLPRWITVFPLSDRERERTVVFPAAALSLKEFIEAIEAQTPLRHRFASCGNGYTILSGEDCSFGVYLCAPAR